MKKKNWREKKKWGQRVFVHTAYLIMGFRLIFFSFFSIFKHCDLLAIIVVYFDSLKTHHIASTTFTYTPQFDHCFRTRPLNPESSTLTSRPKGRGRCDRTAHLYRRFSFQSFLKLKRELFWLLKNRNTKSLHHHLKCWAVVLFDIPCLHYQFRKKNYFLESSGQIQRTKGFEKKN